MSEADNASDGEEPPRPVWQRVLFWAGGFVVVLWVAAIRAASRPLWDRRYTRQGDLNNASGIVALLLTLTIACGPFALIYNGAANLLHHLGIDLPEIPTAAERDLVPPSPTPSEVVLAEPSTDAGGACGQPHARADARALPSWSSYACAREADVGDWDACLPRPGYSDTQGSGCPGRSRCCPPSARLPR